MLVLFSAACARHATQRNPSELLASAPVVEIWLEKARQPWTLTPEMNPDIYYLVVPPEEQRELRFVSGERFLSWRVVLGQQIDFDILFAGVRYPTRIVGVPPMAKFDEAYQAAHRGRIEVSVPEVYELVNIAIALTPTARANKSSHRPRVPLLRGRHVLVPALCRPSPGGGPGWRTGQGPIFRAQDERLRLRICR